MPTLLRRLMRISFIELLSPCIAPLLWPPLYDYCILARLPLTDEEEEGSQSSAERDVTVYYGKEWSRGAHSLAAYYVF
jgi:hypothetical protein